MQGGAHPVGGRRLLAYACALTLALLGLSASAEAAGVKFLRSIPNGGGYPGIRPFTVAPDDTIYEAYTNSSSGGPGTIVHGGRSWDNLGHSIKVNEKCKASDDEKIEKTSEFRAVAIDKHENTLDTSSTVTVKVRQRTTLTQPARCG